MGFVFASRLSVCHLQGPKPWKAVLLLVWWASHRRTYKKEKKSIILFMPLCDRLSQVARHRNSLNFCRTCGRGVMETRNRQKDIYIIRLVKPQSPPPRMRRSSARHLRDMRPLLSARSIHHTTHAQMIALCEKKNSLVRTHIPIVSSPITFLQWIKAPLNTNESKKLSVLFMVNGLCFMNNL